MIALALFLFFFFFYWLNNMQAPSRSSAGGSLIIISCSTNTLTDSKMQPVAITLQSADGLHSISSVVSGHTS